VNGEVRHPPATKGQAMSDSTIEFETEEVERVWQASDEALENAAGTEVNASYTLGSCTGLSVCQA
jgi:hypothetical protein